jgi:phosphoglycolate phosphatase
LKNYKHLLFDLDGTLTDSDEGIINALRYALDNAGISDNDTEKLRSFIGSSLLKTLQDVYGISKDRAEDIASDYRSYYSEKGVFENRLYPGIPELLADLKNAGKRLIVATSKRTTGANQVLDNFKLNEYFDLVVGGSSDGKISEKTDVIRHVFSKTGNDIKTSAVMIGDRKFDILGAHENGIDSIAVMYGYATKEEIDEARPTYRVNTVEELRTLLFKNHEGHEE